jgi:hypothetical protein
MHTNVYIYVHIYIHIHIFMYIYNQSTYSQCIEINSDDDTAVGGDHTIFRLD